MKKKILIFSGAGVSQESGISTFRNSGGLWHDYKVEEVATPEGWKKDREKVLDFYNARRAQLKTVEPNPAHHIIKELENDFEVMVVTQNVDDLHERAGSTNIIHLHGELTKARGCMYEHKSSPLDTIVDIGYEPIKIGDKCKISGSQLRPHIVWFNEPLDPVSVTNSLNFANDADICIVVGTSMKVSPANIIPFETPENCLIYYVDPGECDFEIPNRRSIFFNHIKENATTGMEKVKNELKDIFLED